MIVEHEVIEQIETEERGRPLRWVCDLIQSLDRDRPFEVLRGMWRGGLLLFVDEHGATLPDWKCEQLIRQKDIAFQANVVATANAMTISAGYGNSCAVVTDGTAWCWGHGLYGRLGNGSDMSQPAPVQVTGLTNVTAISTGDAHTCALASNGTAWCWGFGTGGQLGNGVAAHSQVPVQVTGITNAVAISNGGAHSCLAASDGTAWCWGWGGSSALGDGSATSSATPVQVVGLTNVVSISAGGMHSCAVVSNGAAWCWGLGDHGELGNGATSNSSTPVQVTGITNAVAISAGGDHSCALASDGTAWCWGEGRYGELGDGSASSVPVTTPVQANGLTSPVSISAGGGYTCSVASDGTAWCWGSNSTGQLGDAQTHAPCPVYPFNPCSLIPVQVLTPP